MTIRYLQTVTNRRDLIVKGDDITVEDRHPDNGGKPITEAELELIRCVRKAKGWSEFFISQTIGPAWTKTGRRESIYVRSLP